MFLGWVEGIDSVFADDDVSLGAKMRGDTHTNDVLGNVGCRLRRVFSDDESHSERFGGIICLVF